MMFAHFYIDFSRFFYVFIEMTQVICHVTGIFLCVYQYCHLCQTRFEGS